MILVFEQMAISLLMVFCSMEDTKEMCTFLVTVIDTDLEVQEPFSKYSILYWKYRIENMLGHNEAFRMVMLEYEGGTRTFYEDEIDLIGGMSWVVL